MSGREQEFIATCLDRQRYADEAERARRGAERRLKRRARLRLLALAAGDDLCSSAP